MLKYYKSAAILVLLCCLGILPLHAQQYHIHNFRVKGGEVLFDAIPLGQAGDSTGVPIVPTEAFSLGIPGDRPIPLEGKFVSDTLRFTQPVPPGVFPGKQMFTVFQGSDSLYSNIVTVSNSIPQQNGQPLIESLYPRGTSPGRVVSVKGKNFGNNLNNIYIWFLTEEGTELPLAASEVLNPTPATYLTTPDASGQQELKFLLPRVNSLGERLDVAEQTWLEYDLRLRIVVKGQPSANSETLSVVREDYRLKLLLMVMGLFVGFLVFVWGLYTYMHRNGYSGKLNLKALVIDTATNQYSLAKVQALGWTVILILSYLYYVLITFVILDRDSIPDFEPSLLILMGITTGGLLLARSTDRSQQLKAGGAAAIASEVEPSLWDLISENGVVNLASLQLLLFTLVSMGVYILFMTDSNLVETGMPSMPTTLLGLMGISQGGYLTGKLVENNGTVSPAAKAAAKSPAISTPETGADPAVQVPANSQTGETPKPDAPAES